MVHLASFFHWRKSERSLFKFNTVSPTVYVPEPLIELQPLLKALRWCGELPIQILQEPVLKSPQNASTTKQCKVHYKFSVYSSIFLYSLFLGGLRVGFWTAALIFDTVIAPDQNSTELGKFLTWMYKNSISIINSAEWFSLILTTPIFVRFLNNWDKIEAPSTFGNRKRILLHSKFIIGIVMAPTLGFYLVLLSIRIQSVFPDFSIGLWTSIVQTVILQVIVLLEDVKILLMFRTVTVEFRKVCND